MKREYARTERVGEQVRRDLADLIRSSLDDPRMALVSITDVEVSRDLSHAKVFVTVFEEDKAKASIGALNKAAGFLRGRLGQEMRLRSVPELHFHHDASVETGQRMDRLIEEAVAKDANAAPRTDDEPDT